MTSRDQRFLDILTAQTVISVSPYDCVQEFNLTVLSSIHEFGPVTSKYHLDIYFLKFTWLDATVDAIVIGPPRVPLF